MTRSNIAAYLIAAAIGLSGCASDTSPSPQTLARTCILATGCNSGTALDAPVGACATLYRTAINSGVVAAAGVPTREGVRIVSCGTANNCSDYNACITLHHDATYCSAHPGLSCDGSIIVNCSSARTEAAVDCASYGLSCQQVGNEASCTDGAACDPAVDRPRCDGNRFIACNANTRLSAPIDCAQFSTGWTCGSGGDGNPRCIPPTNACSGNATRCDGDTLISCSMALGHEQRVDCTQIYSGGHCSVANNAAQCVPGNGSTCSLTTPDTCVGTQLQTCLEGALTTIDCTSLGFRTCQVDTARAHCVN